MNRNCFEEITNFGLSNLFQTAYANLHAKFNDITRIKALFHSSQKLTCKLAARTFFESQYLKVLAAVGLRIGLCDEWKRGLRQTIA